MNRLPSYHALELMSDSERHGILSVFARDLRDELEMLESGLVHSSNGVPLAQHRRNVKRRLAQVYKHAFKFGDNIGQPVTDIYIEAAKEVSKIWNERLGSEDFITSMTEQLQLHRQLTVENYQLSRYRFTEDDDTNLNRHLDAVLVALKDDDISHSKARGLLAHLVMLGVNDQPDHAARFVAVSPEEHFRND